MTSRNGTKTNKAKLNRPRSARSSSVEARRQYKIHSTTTVTTSGAIGSTTRNSGGEQVARNWKKARRSHGGVFATRADTGENEF
eukprot:3851041-Rhodomonas_salina.1